MLLNDIDRYLATKILSKKKKWGKMKSALTTKWQNKIECSVSGTANSTLGKCFESEESCQRSDLSQESAQLCENKPVHGPQKCMIFALLQFHLKKRSRKSSQN